MKKPRVLIAGLFHETHTFLDEGTSREDFALRMGQEMLECDGDSSPLGGALEFGRKAAWELAPLVDFRALPGGTAESFALAAFRERLFADRDVSGINAVLLILHGAMAEAEERDVEGALLDMLREHPALAGVPVFAVLDLHANVSERMVRHADAFFAYRENPHTDARETALRAARCLDDCLKTGRRPRMFHRHTGIVWPPTGTGTADEPMASLNRMARELEEASAHIVNINVVPGFAFADTRETGLSFQIVTHGEQEEAEKALGALAALAQERREEGMVRDMDPAQVMRLVSKRAEGLTVLVEPSDNIGAGAPGDCTGCLRALIEHQIPESAVCIRDPEAVRLLEGVEIGQRRRLFIGGKGSRFDPGPVDLEVELVSRSDGRFRLQDLQSHLASMCGDTYDMGPCAVVRAGGVTILLTTHRTPPFDLGQWVSQGIRPETLNVIVVKAAVAHRRAYDPIAARSFTVDTPGPCRSDLSQFDYVYTPSTLFT